MSAASLKVGFIYCLLLEESLSDSWDVSEGLFTAAEHPHVIIYDREKSSTNSTEVEVLQQFCLIKNLVFTLPVAGAAHNLSFWIGQKCFQSSIQELEIIKRSLLIFFLGSFSNNFPKLNSEP